MNCIECIFSGLFVIKKERYNPFILLYGGELDEDKKSLIRAALKAELCDAEGAFDLIDFGDNRAV